MLGGSSSACTTDTAKEAELAFWITVKRLADLKLDGSNTYSRPESVSGLELDSQFWFRFQLVLTCLPLGGTVSISPFSLLYTVHCTLCFALLFLQIGSRGTSNPRYQSLYEAFVYDKSDTFKKWQPFTQALSLLHQLKTFEIWSPVESLAFIFISVGKVLYGFF